MFEVNKKYDISILKTDTTILEKLNFDFSMEEREKVFRLKDDIQSIVFAFIHFEELGENYTLNDVLDIFKIKAKTVLFKKALAIYRIYLLVSDRLSHIETETVSGYVDYLANFGVDYCSYAKEMVATVTNDVEKLDNSNVSIVKQERNLVFDLLSHTSSLFNFWFSGRGVGTNITAVNKALKNRDFVDSEYIDFICSTPHFHSWVKETPEVLVDLDEKNKQLLVIWYSFAFIYKNYYWE